MIKTHKNKIILLFIIVFCLLPTQALAGLDAYLIKVADEVYVYEKDGVESSFLGITGPELYQDFLQKFGSGFFAFRDKSGKYVDYKAIEDAFLATPTGQTFNLNQYIEGSEAPNATGVPATVKVAYVESNVVKYRIENSTGGGTNPDNPTTATVSQVIPMTNTIMRVIFTGSVAPGDYELSKFSINGLTVTNAVLKPGTNNTVNLTTTAQTQGTSYTLTYNGKTVGTAVVGLGPNQVTPEAPTVSANTADGTINAGGATNLEYSVNGGSTWADYNPASPPTGLSGEVLVRVKADGTNPAGIPITLYFSGTMIVDVNFISGALAGVGYKSIQVLTADEVFFVEVNGTRLKYEGKNLYGNTSTEYTTGMTVTVVAKNSLNQVVGQRTVTVP